MDCSTLGILEVRAPVWNSTFKIIEAPMSYMNKLLNTHGRWFEIISSSPVTGMDFSNAFDPVWYGLKKFNFTEVKLGAAGFGGKLQILGKHLYDRKITILATAGQIIAYPISWIFTPVTVIADIFAGVIQATIRACQGASKEEIKSILHKKVIAAPAQQIAYTINNFVAFGPIFGGVAKSIAIIAALIVVCVSAISLGSYLFLGLPLSGGIAIASAAMKGAMEGVVQETTKVILLHSILLGDKLYRDAQGMVGKLPKFFIPDGYNIFIENGALDQFGDNAFDPEGEYAEFKRQAKDFRRESNARGPYSSERDSIEKDLNEIKEQDPSLKGLRDWFTMNKPPYTLFGFKSKEEVNESDLKKSYMRLAFICHPDKHPDKSKREAETLFKMVKTARDDIEETILKK